MYFCKMELRQITLEEINKLNKNTLMEALGIECVALGIDYLKVKMPVDHRTKQPMGILHGGASAALIETIGSIGSFLLIDAEKQIPVGLEVNANHLGSVSNGNVIATGTITSYYSDERLKNFTSNIYNSLDIINNLNGYYYLPNTQAINAGFENEKQIGLSAQEVQKVLPEIVKIAPFDMFKDENGNLILDYDQAYNGYYIVDETLSYGTKTRNITT